MNVLAVAGLVFIVMLFFFYASYSIRSGVYLKTLCRNREAGKVAALTFDDGPDGNTEKVLDILQKHNVKACFFCIGSKIAGNEEVIRRINADGHLIGNHSYSHSGKFPLYSSSRMQKDIEKCSEEIEKITDEKVRLFRPPFGVTNPTIAKVIKRFGFITIGWNIRTLDTCIKSKKKIEKRIERKLSPGSVILLHDNLAASPSTLAATLELLQRNGYRCVRIDELFNLNLES